jgi:hypothetical protein
MWLVGLSGSIVTDILLADEPVLKVLLSFFQQERVVQDLEVFPVTDPCSGCHRAL